MLNHPAFKLLVIAIAIALVVMWIFLIHIGTDYWYVYLPTGLLITGYTIWYMMKGVKRIKSIEKYTKMFLAGQTTLVRELSFGSSELEVINSLNSGCFWYIQNVYMHRVQHILETETLNRIETAYLEDLLEHLVQLEDFTSEETNQVFSQFYDFNFDLLKYACNSDAAQECLDIGISIQEFISEFNEETLKRSDDSTP